MIQNKEENSLVFSITLPLFLRDSARPWQRFFTWPHFGQVLNLLLGHSVHFLVKSLALVRTLLVGLTRIPCHPQDLICFLIHHHPSGDIWSPWPALSKNPLRSGCFILNAPLLQRFSLGNIVSTDLAPWLWISTFPFCLWNWAQSFFPLQNPTSVVCTLIPVVPWIKTALLCFK